MSVATVFGEISLKEKNWGGSGPIRVPSLKESQISSKKWCFEIFHRAKASTFKMSMDNCTSLELLCFLWAPLGSLGCFGVPKVSFFLLRCHRTEELSVLLNKEACQFQSNLNS